MIVFKVCEVCGIDENSEFHIYDSEKYNAILCEKCYAKIRYQQRLNEKDKEVWICDECSKKGFKNIDVFHSNKFNKTLCIRCYTLIERHGKIIRTVNDPNKIVKHENHAEIYLYNREGKYVDSTLVDLEDVEKCQKYKWHKSVTGYVIGANAELGDPVRMHRYIMNCPDDKVVDHINHNTLDNRKINLRICTNMENSWNKDKIPSNTSGFRGVYYYKSRDKWCAGIQVDGVSKNLGYFKEFEDAVNARKEAELEYYGEFRYDYLPKELKESG